VFFSFQSLNSAWSPMVDDYLIPDNPIKLVEAQKFAKVRYTSICFDQIMTSHRYPSLMATVRMRERKYTISMVWQVIHTSDSLFAAVASNITYVIGWDCLACLLKFS